MLFRILTIYQVLGSVPEAERLGDLLATAQPLEDNRPYARFGTQHYEIVKKLLLSSCGKWKTQRDLFSLAQEEFERAQLLPSVTLDTFIKQVRKIMMHLKPGIDNCGKLRAHLYTRRHFEMLEECIRAHPNRCRERLFDEVTERFSEIGFRPITEGLFRLRYAQIQKERKKMTNVRNDRPPKYTERHREILKQIIQAHPSESGRRIFELASATFHAERLHHLHFKSFGSRFTEIRAALELSSNRSVLPKIGLEASKFLSPVHRDNPNITPSLAWGALAESGKFTSQNLPSKKSVTNWLKYRQRIARASKI